MSEIKFWDHQERGINQIAVLAAKKVRRIVFQCATGGGKTVLFAGLTDRFRRKYTNQRVLIAVHRQELMHQTVAALKKVANIDAGMLIAGYNTPVRKVNDFMVPYNAAQVIVCMIETLHNRFKKYHNYLGDIGMLITDECHLANFNKIYDHFPKSLIVGFTATPISANKRIPMNTFFDDIVSPVTIEELIADGRLAKNITITIKGAVNRKKLKVKGGDFDENEMAKAFSTAKHIEECVKAYTKYCMGQKTMIFNCNIEHSKLVTDAFVRAGYNCRHIDGNATDEERTATLSWFRDTHDAICCNVGLWTTGFDEPTVLNIIMNRATMSLPLWLQCCGRGSRAIPGVKDHFKIIDLGANVAEHQDWHYPHNWVAYFHHPEKVGPKKGGGPTKLCVECEAMIHLSTKICPYCGANNAKEIEYDKAILELQVLTQGVDIDKFIAQNEAYSPYRTLHQIKGALIKRFRTKYKHMTCAQNVRDLLNDRYQEYVKDWCDKEDKPYDRTHKNMTRNWLMAELDRYYGKIDHQQPAHA